MGEFLQGWRRKLGAATLVLALISMVGWNRSYVWFDSMHVNGRPFLVSVSSGYGQLILCWTAHRKGYQPVGVSINPLPEKAKILPVNMIWKWERAGFRFGDANAFFLSASFLLVPYWSIVIPLTLLSAHLLLSRSHTAKQKNIAERIPVEGA